MALSANTVFEVRTTGSDSSGGGFVTGAAGTDRSQQAAAHATLSAASVVHTTTTQINVAAGDYTVTDPGDVGNLLQITGGTATAGFYQITVADVANNRWTVDRAAGAAGATVVGAMGGALVSAGKAAGAMTVSGQITWVDDGAYNISSTTANASGGRVSLGAANTRMLGYNVTRGDSTGTRPVLTATVNTMTLVTVGEDVVCGNIELSAGAATGIAGTNAASQAFLHDMKMTGANATAAFRGQTNSTHFRCEATGGTVQGFLGEGGHFLACKASAIAGRGFGTSGTSTTVFANCLSFDNTGGTGKGFDHATATGSAIFLNCTAYGNAADSFDNSAGPVASCNWFNCLAVNSALEGFSRNGRAWHCAAFNNTGGNYDATVIQINSITLTVDPFVNAAGGNFGLNSTAGGGADCKGAGTPGVYPGLANTIGYLDIGAVQAQASASAATTVNSIHALLALPRSWDIE